MSTSDHPTDDAAAHGVHHHPGHEGEYDDTDVTSRQTEPPVGEYDDTDVSGPQPTAPADEGSFADHDVVSQHRHPTAEGSFEDAEIPGLDEDVEAVQVERAQQHHAPVDDPDAPPAGSAGPT